jgi:hypothetical protein
MHHPKNLSFTAKNAVTFAANEGPGAASNALFPPGFFKRCYRLRSRLLYFHLRTEGAERTAEEMTEGAIRSAGGAEYEARRTKQYDDMLDAKGNAIAQALVDGVKDAQAHTIAKHKPFVDDLAQRMHEIFFKSDWQRWEKARKEGESQRERRASKESGWSTRAGVPSAANSYGFNFSGGAGEEGDGVFGQSLGCGTSSCGTFGAPSHASTVKMERSAAVEEEERLVAERRREKSVLSAIELRRFLHLSTSMIVLTLARPLLELGQPVPNPDDPIGEPDQVQEMVGREDIFVTATPVFGLDAKGPPFVLFSVTEARRRVDEDMFSVSRHPVIQQAMCWLPFCRHLGLEHLGYSGLEVEKAKKPPKSPGFGPQLSLPRSTMRASVRSKHHLT